MVWYYLIRVGKEKRIETFIAGKYLRKYPVTVDERSR